MPGHEQRIRVGEVTIHCMRRGVGGACNGPPLIYVHGGTFPSDLAVGWGFAERRSWADDLVDAGHDLWTFDFGGYGRSDRYPAMSQAPAPGPLGRSDVAVAQLAAVADHVRVQTGADKVALLAHSWGGLIAGRYAAEHPASVARLVLFGPILKRDGAAAPAEPPSLPGWATLTLDAQLKRFREDEPEGEPHLIPDAAFAAWGEAYLATDPQATAPRAVAVPSGPVADIAAAWSGEMPYDPARIACPVRIVRGALDSLCTDEDVDAFRRSLVNAVSFEDARLERGTHLMLLETGRERLWRAVRQALA